VNVVIALFDPDHTLHERAHAWWAANTRQGWSSSPITENGVVRVMSNPGYSATERFTPAELVARLSTFCDGTNHEFWPDDVSLRDAAAILADRIHGARQVTDLYLLALAVKRNGRFVTFDRSIPLSAVPGASAGNLVVV
jgi:toxin-antitoxin system PIN domain toxin